MSTDYSALLLEYPAVISKDQLYRICHISKRKATWLLEHGVIPCKDSGKKTRRFQIYTADVVNYLITLENEPQKVAIPAGIFTNDKNREKKKSPLTRLTHAELKRHLCLRWNSEPDALTITQISKITGYRLARLNGELLDKNGKKSIYNCENYKYLLDAPFKISARCCYHMKKAPLNKFERQSGRHPITGVLACESKLREQSWIKFGCNGFERQRPLSQPLAFWLEEDILRYLKMTGIPYAPIYGDIVESRKKNGTPILKTTGVSRSGCMYCMYGVHLEHEPNRFQLMQVTHPQQYDYCINKLGCGAVLDYIGVPYRNQQLEVDHC